MFGEDLKNRIKEEGITQKEFGEMIGICHQTVSAWVVGRSRPRIETLHKICDLFDMPFEKYLKECSSTSSASVMTFDSSKLRKERIAQGIDRKQLANKIGVSEETIKNWENSKVRPSAKNIGKLNDAFNVRAKYWEKEKEYGAFEPKVYVDPDVKKKVDLSENPYRAKLKPLDSFVSVPAKKEEQPKDSNDDIEKMKRNFEVMKDWLTAMAMTVQKDMDTITDEIVKKDEQIAQLEEKVTYLRGMIDGSFTEQPELEKKSWWKRLWA